MTDCFERDIPGAPLTILLPKTINSPEFKQHGAVRNVLSRRGAIPRLVRSDSPSAAVPSNPKGARCGLRLQTGVGSNEPTRIATGHCIPSTESRRHFLNSSAEYAAYLAMIPPYHTPMG